MERKYIDNENCEKSHTGKHRMYYDYTWLISWDTGFLVNIVKCASCGKQAQIFTMYEPRALYALDLKFKKDTIERRIIRGKIVDSQSST